MSSKCAHRPRMQSNSCYTNQTDKPSWLNTQAGQHLQQQEVPWRCLGCTGQPGLLLCCVPSCHALDHLTHMRTYTRIYTLQHLHHFLLLLPHIHLARGCVGRPSCAAAMRRQRQGAFETNTQTRPPHTTPPCTTCTASLSHVPATSPKAKPPHPKAPRKLPQPTRLRPAHAETNDC